MRRHGEFRDLQLQLSMLVAVYGRRQDEAEEMNRGQL